MTNHLKCESCGKKNPLYKLNCFNCHAILRKKVSTLTMSKFLWKLVESPKSAFIELIQSEQKNFAYLVLILIATKFALVSNSISSIILSNNGVEVNGFENLISEFILIIAFIFLFSLVEKLLFSFSEFSLRKRDISAINIYSLFPITFALLILFPIEIALFGAYWLIANPSPFLIKPMAAYTLWGLEVIMFVWSFILNVIAKNIQTNSILVAILLSIIYFGSIIGIVVLFPLS